MVSGGIGDSDGFGGFGGPGGMWRKPRRQRRLVKGHRAKPLCPNAIHRAFRHIKHPEEERTFGSKPPLAKLG
jgi:hypothetical protein